MLKSETLLKTVSLYLLYFLYTYFASAIISLVPMINSQVIMAVLDILFIYFIALYIKEIVIIETIVKHII